MITKITEVLSRIIPTAVHTLMALAAIAGVGALFLASLAIIGSFLWHLFT